MNHFPMRLEIRLDWSEMDMFGHINNVSYFKYVQASRVNYWQQIGLTMPHHNGVGPMLAATSCQFRKPLFFPGNITVAASIIYIKNSSFGIKHDVLNDAGELVAEAEDVIVLYNFDKAQKEEVPVELRNKIEAIEGRSF